MKTSPSIGINLVAQPSEMRDAAAPPARVGAPLADWTTTTRQENQDTMPRPDETQYRLLAWTGDSGAAERLAVQVLLASGFQDPDPSHPYGGPDGGRDAVLTRDSNRWVMAVYFPRGEHRFSEIKGKFTSDLGGAKTHQPKGFAFVTNQEITLGERQELAALADGLEVEIFHMERIAALLDQPEMVGIRQQFLGIDPGSVPLNIQLKIDGVGQNFVDGEELRELLLEAAAESDRENADQLRNMSPDDALRQSMLARVLGQEAPSEPPTPEQIEVGIVGRKSVAEREWPRIEDYVAGFFSPALRFTVTNVAASFLYDVKVVMTFTGAHGVEKRYIDDFEFERLLDPDYERPQSIYDPMRMSAFVPARPRDYPVEWKNRESGLEVRITLSELPPGAHFEWDSADYEDVALVAASGSDSIHVSWVAVARGHGTPFVGPEFDIAVETVPIADAVNAILEQVRAD